MSKQLEENFPRSWSLTTVGEISAQIQYGYTASSTSETIGPKYLRITDIQDNFVNWENVPFCEIDDEIKPKYLLTEGDLVFARTGSTVGKSFLIQGDIPESVFASYLIRLQFLSGINRKFILYFFKSDVYWNQIKKSKLGIGQPNVNGTLLSKVQIPIAPLNEQNRIVEELELQFSRLETGEIALKRLQHNLTRYRSAILKNIGEGRLTISDHKILNQNGLNESSKDLIKKIFKSSTKESLFSEEIDLHPFNLENTKVPLHWSIVKLGEISEVIDPNPKHRNPDYVKEGFPFLSTAQFAQPDGFDISTAKQVSEQVVLEQEKRCNYSDRSLVLSRKGTIGVTRFLPTDYRFALLDSLCVINPSEFLSAKFVNLIINTPFVQKQILQKARGIALKQISVGDVRSLLIPIPPISEQIYIVNEVERRFSLLDDFSSLISLNLNRASKLRRSILKLAFSGKLVGQNKEDESATQLLKKVKRAKQKITKNDQVSRNPRQKSMPITPVNTLDELLVRLDRLGGEAEPDRLLIETGLGDNIEIFFDLLRHGRNEKKLEVPIGETKPIRRVK